MKNTTIFGLAVASLCIGGLPAAAHAQQRERGSHPNHHATITRTAPHAPAATTPRTSQAAGRDRGGNWRNHNGNWRDHNGSWTHNGNWRDRNGRWHHRNWRHRGNTTVVIGGFGYPYYGYGYYPYGYGYGGYGYGGYGYGYGGYYTPSYVEAAPVVYEGQPIASGADGSVIVEVQRRLARAGLYHGAIDGVIGSGTRRAIRAYERTHRLPVDGLIDDELLETMGLS